PGHQLRCAASGARQVWPAHIADEESIAGQNSLRRVRVFPVGHQYANALGCVSGRLENSQIYFADRDLVALAHGAVRNTGSGFGAKNDLGPCASREFAVTADEIRVQMSFDDVLDLELLGCG